AGIHLLDRDVEPEPAAASFVRPHAFDLRHASGFELVPNRAAAISAAIERVIVGRNARDGAEQHGVVAMHEAFNTNGWLLLEPARVVAGPFTERAFIDEVIERDIAFERDLGVGRDRQAGDRSRNGLDRLTEQPAGRVVFVLAIGDLEASN